MTPPKFKTGDWVVTRTGRICQVTGVPVHQLTYPVRDKTVEGWVYPLVIREGGPSSGWGREWTADEMGLRKYLSAIDVLGEDYFA